ncbi:MAG: hypothetical protein JXB38_08580 [Anaerolineales bacterium]|nr:hypothetical protein [Anaerolineales bacterium]
MTNTINEKMDTSQPMIYQIRIEEHIDRQWTDWFEGLVDITLEDNRGTLITGQMVDQAALHGLLKKIRDLGLTLVSVIRVDPGQIQGLDAQE